MSAQESPGSRRDFERRLQHLHHYLEQTDLCPETKRDLDKIYHGFEPNGALLTKDSKPVGPNWRMLEVMREGFSRGRTAAPIAP